MKPIIFETITDKRSIPFNSSGTGTIATHGIAIVGTGTAFTTEMRAGSYLVNLAQDEVRRVYRVDSDTLAFLEVAFTSDISAGTTPEIIAAHQAKVKEISLKTSDTIQVDGAPFTGIITWSKTGNDRSARPDLVEPIIVDATGGSCDVSIINY